MKENIKIVKITSSNIDEIFEDLDIPKNEDTLQRFIKDNKEYARKKNQR